MRRAAARGQATVELALGALVLVTVLLFGVPFGELAIATLKVKEATAFAALDVTGQRSDTFSVPALASGNTFAPFNPAPVGAAAKARYADLDGMSDRAGNSWTQALTRLDAFDLSCRRDATLSFRLELSRGPKRPELNAALGWLRGRYRDQGGASCTAQARASAFRIPTGFAEGGDGFFQVKHREVLEMPVCGAGFPSGGSCAGRLAVLTGEWAFDGPMGDSQNEDVPSTEHGRVNNPAYRDAVKRVFDLNGGPLSDSSAITPGQHILEVAAGMRPGAQPEWLDETRFSMSALLDRSDPQVTISTHTLTTPANGRLSYQTSGADLHSDYVGWDEASGRVNGVPRCFLGLYGCRYPRGN